MSSYDLNALSGINASSTGLSVISNNLANAETVGFKSSRAEFSDLFTGAQTSPGSGTRVGAITQDFTQGTLSSTGRDLDMAVDGEGFFVLDDQTGKYPNVYTRNGSFKLDQNGLITDQTGNKLQGYLLNTTLSTETNPVFDTTLGSIDLNKLNKTPKATDQMTYDVNVKGDADNNADTSGVGVGETASLGLLTNFTTATSYSGSPDFSTVKNVYDSLGGEHRLTSNFYKRDVVTTANSTVDANGNTVAAGSANSVKYSSWIVQYTMEDQDANGNWVTSGHTANPTTGAATALEGQVFELRFNTDGGLIDARTPTDQTALTGTATANGELPAASWTSAAAGDKNVALNWVVDTPLTGANDPLGNPSSTTVNIGVDFSNMSQYAGSNNLRGVSQNGYQIGDLVGLTTGLDGIIQANYSNGRAVPVAQVALANFTDKNALTKLGGQTYAESYGSGTVQIGTANNNGYGTINSGSLEYSNVDTANELVHMIQTQRTYQASTQVLSTSQTLMQRILQL